MSKTTILIDLENSLFSSNKIKLSQIIFKIFLTSILDENGLGTDNLNRASEDINNFPLFMKLNNDYDQAKIMSLETSEAITVEQYFTYRNLTKEDANDRRILSAFIENFYSTPVNADLMILKDGFLTIVYSFRNFLKLVYDSEDFSLADIEIELKIELKKEFINFDSFGEKINRIITNSGVRDKIIDQIGLDIEHILEDLEKTKETLKFIENLDKDKFQVFLLSKGYKYEFVKIFLEKIHGDNYEDLFEKILLNADWESFFKQDFRENFENIEESEKFLKEGSFQELKSRYNIEENKTYYLTHNVILGLLHSSYCLPRMNSVLIIGDEEYKSIGLDYFDIIAKEREFKVYEDVLSALKEIVSISE